jgi:hypothetical protein
LKQPLELKETTDSTYCNSELGLELDSCTSGTLL